MTQFPVSGSYRLGGREMRRGHGTGSGGSGGGVGGMEESSSGLVGSWRSRDCAWRFGLSTCVGLAGVRGDSGAGAWTMFGLLGSLSLRVRGREWAFSDSVVWVMRVRRASSLAAHA